ncbi:MAG: hypothetical protein CL878_03155 [Dehalococcoidia bacterium]|nr:hypothetical protein [Dehalococcoidia bacterium]
MPLLGLDQVTTLVDGLDHPEGVAWGPDGYLYAGGEAGQLYRIDPKNQSSVEFANTGGVVLGLALDVDANIYACDVGNPAVKRISPDGEVTTFADRAGDWRLSTPNYPVFDEQGRLYISDSGKWTENNGCVVRFDPDGSGEVFCPELTNFPNGMALGPDGGALYVVLSLMPGVVRVTVNADGSAGEIATVMTLPEGEVPDGLAFDTRDNLYVSCYRPDRIYRLTPDGQLDIVADDPQGTVVAAPTNICFGGPDMEQLYIASLGRWHIGVTSALSIRGHRLPYPSL